MPISRPTLAILFVVIAVFGGFLFGQIAGGVAVALAPVPKLIIQLIKMAATPLVFFAVVEAVVRHRIAGGDFGRLLTVVLSNALIAVAIAVVIANLFVPGDYLKFFATQVGEGAVKPTVSLTDALQKQLPASVVQPFADNDIMATIIIALLLAFAWRRVRERRHDMQAGFERAESVLTLAREIAEQVLIWIVALVPIAVFVAVAKLSHEQGLAPLRGLGQYVLLCLLGMTVHVLFTYSGWLLLVARRSLAEFWRVAAQPVLYAFSVNSSLVALPLTLRALDKLGVSRRASTLSACIGTNLNNDGIILYECFTFLAIAQALGMDLPVATQVLAAVYCVIMAMGVAGVPEAGVVALTLVLSAFGLPTEVIITLLSVDWIIARCRSFLNVSADMVGAVVLQRWLR